MTTEITSLTQNLLSSARELSGSTQTRVGTTAKVEPTQAVAGGGGQDAAPQGIQGKPASKKPGQVMDGESIKGAVSDLNAMAQDLHRELQFSLDQKSDTVVVKIIDKQTNKVLRQIPPEDLLELRQRLKDAAGVIFRGQA